MLATLPRALAFAASLLRDVSMADDVVHDCYCRILQKADVYDIPREGTKILFRSITNACIDRNYRQRPHQRLESMGDDEIGVADPKTTEPAIGAMGRELEERIATGLDRLPMPQRAALELRSLGHSQQEIAEALGVSGTHAGVLIHRARQALAKHLGVEDRFE